jgi:hypothetical protein
MYAAHRQSYSRWHVGTLGGDTWLHAYTEPDVFDVPSEVVNSSRRASPSAKSSWHLDSAPATAAPPATVPSPVLPLRSRREHIKARFRLLRQLPANHDNEGADAPHPKSVDTAIAFIDSVKEPFPSCFATLSDDGSAVIEFDGKAKGFFADLTFRGEGTSIECYRRQAGTSSEFFEGALNSPEARNFIKNYLCVVY